MPASISVDGGRLFDATGSYDILWWAIIVAGLAAALIHWPIDDRPVARLAARRVSAHAIPIISMARR